MSKETELKLAVAPEDARRLLRHPLMAGAERLPSRTLLNIYYDTPQFALHQRRVALRLRRQGRQWLQTVKAEGDTAGGLSVRPEWEYPYDGRRFDFAPIDDPALRAWLEGDDILPKLQPVFETRFRREVRRIAADPGSEVEIAFDRGTIEAGGRKAPLCELELERLGGPVAALFDLARQIAQTVALRPEPLSKAERGYRLADIGDARPLPPFAPMDPTHSPVAALRSAVSNALEQFGDPMPVLDQTPDDEGVAQARLAWRRLRAALRALGPVLPGRRTAIIRRALKPVQRRLDKLHGWNLLIAACREADGNADADAIRGAMEERRGKSRARSADALREPAAGLALIDLLALLNEEGPASASDPNDMITLARRHLRRAAKRLRRSAQELGPDGNQRSRLHEAVERLSDQLWLFGALFPAPLTAGDGGLLSALEADLDYLAMLDGAGPKLARADRGQAAQGIAAIGETHLPRYQAILAALPSRLADLRTHRFAWEGEGANDDGQG